MRSEGQIRHKLGQVQFRHLKQEVQKGLSRLPDNCTHNGDVSSSTKVHLCLHPDLQGTVCDARKGGVSRARECPHFQCRNTKDGLKGDFLHFLRTAERSVIAARYPVIAALRWVLDAEDVDEALVPTQTIIPAPPPVYRSWSIRVEGPGTHPGPPVHSWVTSRGLPSVPDSLVRGWCL